MKINVKHPRDNGVPVLVAHGDTMYGPHYRRWVDILTHKGSIVRRCKIADRNTALINSGRPYAGKVF